MVAIGLSTASCTLVGQNIGKGDVVKAKEYFMTFQILTVLILIVTSSSIYIYKEAFMAIFNTPEEEMDLIRGCIWLISFSTFPDGFKGMLMGIIKALGIQWYIAFINIGGHWLINLTL